MLVRDILFNEGVRVLFAAGLALLRMYATPALPATSILFDSWLLWFIQHVTCFDRYESQVLRAGSSDELLAMLRAFGDQDQTY